MPEACSIMTGPEAQQLDKKQLGWYNGISPKGKIKQKNIFSRRKIMKVEFTKRAMDFKERFLDRVEETDFGNVDFIKRSYMLMDIAHIVTCEVLVNRLFLNKITQIDVNDVDDKNELIRQTFRSVYNELGLSDSDFELNIS